jgi:predicted DsbA family dithiol-disulfide isomerase
MQRTALELGLNVTRPDITLELASSVGLQMNRFVPAWKSEQTRRLVLQEHRLATARGVRGVPTLVIGGRWMLSGLRDADEYRQHILACLRKFGRGEEESGQALH